MQEAVNPLIKGSSDIVIVCVGTDRATGDSLGPLTGYYLTGLVKSPVYGTLEKPVHAGNLSDTLTEINRIYRKPLIIGVDACLGKVSNVGMLMVNNKPLRPGAAVSKTLPEVGQISLTGIVNFAGGKEMGYVLIQNTRLYVVMKMANVIAEGIYHCLENIEIFDKEVKTV